MISHELKEIGINISELHLELNEIESFFKIDNYGGEKLKIYHNTEEKLPISKVNEIVQTRSKADMHPKINL